MYAVNPIIWQANQNVIAMLLDRGYDLAPQQGPTTLAEERAGYAAYLAEAVDRTPATADRPAFVRPVLATPTQLIEAYASYAASLGGLSYTDYVTRVYYRFAAVAPGTAPIYRVEDVARVVYVIHDGGAQSVSTRQVRAVLTDLKAGLADIFVTWPALRPIYEPRQFPRTYPINSGIMITDRDLAPEGAAAFRAQVMDIELAQDPTLRVFNHFLFSEMMYDVMENICCPTYRVIPPEEAPEMRAEANTENRQFMHMLSLDRAKRWYGWKRGTIVEITRQETLPLVAQQTTAYRIIV